MEAITPSEVGVLQRQLQGPKEIILRRTEGNYRYTYYTLQDPPSTFEWSSETLPPASGGGFSITVAQGSRLHPYPLCKNESLGTEIPIIPILTTGKEAPINPKHLLRMIMGDPQIQKQVERAASSAPVSITKGIGVVVCRENGHSPWQIISVGLIWRCPEQKTQLNEPQRTLPVALAKLASNATLRELARSLVTALLLIFGGCGPIKEGSDFAIATQRPVARATRTLPGMPVALIEGGLNELAEERQVDPSQIEVFKSENNSPVIAVENAGGKPQVLAVYKDGKWYRLPEGKGNPFYYKEVSGERSHFVCRQQDPQKECTDIYKGVIYFKPLGYSKEIPVTKREIVKKGYCVGRGPTGCSWGEGSTIGKWESLKDETADEIRGFIIKDEKETTPTVKPTTTSKPTKSPTTKPTQIPPEKFHQWVEENRKGGKIRVTCDIWPQDGKEHEIAFDTQTREGVAERPANSNGSWRPVKKGMYYPCYTKNGDLAVCREHGKGEVVAVYKRVCVSFGLWCEENWFMGDVCKLK